MEIAGKRRILVVDDEQTIAKSVTWVLNIEGFETRTAFNGAEAIQTAESFGPDALICDVLMPGISGVETAEHIRAMFPMCKVLLISGHVSLADLIPNNPEGEHRFDFLPKPVHPRVLIERLRNLLHGTPPRE